MNLIVWTLIAYLLGSVPTAFLLSKLTMRADIRNAGSGNVGTLNFLRVSGSKWLAAVVLLIDAGKGFAAVWLAAPFLPADLLIFPALAAVLGHVFPVWLRFRGGRGLATLAGIFLYLHPLSVAAWLLIFLVIYLPAKKYILAGVVALIVANILIGVFLPLHLFLISSATSMVVLMKYRNRLREELQTT